MEGTYFSLIVWTHDTDMDQFKDMLESIDEQEYREFELYILDNNATNAIEVTIKEFFPDIVDKVHYRRLKKNIGGAYAYNIGAHFAEGAYLVFLNQHDRLNGNTLSSINDKIQELRAADGAPVEADGIQNAMSDTLTNSGYIIYTDEILILRQTSIRNFFCRPIILVSLLLLQRRFIEGLETSMKRPRQHIYMNICFGPASKMSRLSIFHHCFITSVP